MKGGLPNDRKKSSGLRVILLRGSLSDRGLLYLCLLLSSLYGLVIVGLDVYRNHAAEELEAEASLLDPDKIENMVPQISGLINVILRDVSPTRSFVIFESGTVVIIAEPCEDPEAEALGKLMTAAKSPVFAIDEIGDDYAVRFSGPVFSHYDGKAVKVAHNSILNHWKDFLNVTEREALAARSEEPDFMMKVGLVARSFMRRDSENQKVVKILKARPPSDPEKAGT